MPTPPRSGNRLRHLFLVADLAGTAVFAAEGAMAARAARLDLLGIAVLGFVTALGGGMLRDVLIGDTPPAALKDRRYPLAVLAGIATALLFGAAQRAGQPGPLPWFDAAGLALFAVSGTEKALDRGGRGWAAILLGTITAVGGGTIRDVLLAGVPSVLRADFYATAALLGSALMVALHRAGAPARACAAAGGLLCFALRMLALRFHWHLPVLG